MKKNISCEVLVIGSGPGGAITACLLAEAGMKVVLVEEGAHLPLTSAPSFSSEEMEQKYRHGGLTVAFGKNKIVYAEAKCVGGGSEINSGLYHRPLDSAMEAWCQKYKIKGLDNDTFSKYLEETERDLNVSPKLSGLSSPSSKLIEGAQRLAWGFVETPRCFKYHKDSEGKWQGKRQSMSETYIPRALKAGCQLLPHTKVDKLITRGKKAGTAIANRGEIKIDFKNVFVCAGAIQTPFLLRKSGITHHVGNSLRMHPMVRVAARFKEKVNDYNGVPVVQIDQFKPALTLGCSCSSPGHIALWLSGSMQEKREKLNSWQQMSIFYAAIAAEGKGRIRQLPLTVQPFVSYELTKNDLTQLCKGVYRLGEVLFAAGATDLILPIEGFAGATKLEDLEILCSPDFLPKKMDITTIHLFSSCPMGEDRNQCAVDSYGKLFDFDNIYLNDASILPECPGVNPQATIMALARRNVKNFLDSK